MRILFVEQDQSLLKNIIPVLIQQNFAVDVAFNVIDGLNKIQIQNNTNLIFLDVSSIEYTNNIADIINSFKKYAPYSKIVLIISTTDTNLLPIINNLKNSKLIVDFLFKPYSVNDIMNCINAINNTQSSNTSNFYGFNNQNMYNNPNPNQNPNFTFNNNKQFNMNNFNFSQNQSQQQTQQNPNFNPLFDNPTNFNTNNPFTQNFQTFENFDSFGIPKYNSNQADIGMKVGSKSCVKIALHCPKGGVGKSTIAKELAVCYAYHGKIGNRPAKVCLLDWNFENGDLATMLNIQGTNTIATWIEDINSKLTKMGIQDFKNPKVQQALQSIQYSYQEIEQNFLEIHNESGLRILASPSNPRLSYMITRHHLTFILNTLEKFFDIIVIDTVNTPTLPTLLALEQADIKLLVANLEVVTIKNIANLLKTLNQINANLSNTFLIVNEITKNDLNNAQQLSQYLNLPVIGVLYKNNNMANYHNQGKSIVITNPKDPFTVFIKKIANQIYPIIWDKNIKGMGVNSKGGKQNLFKQLLKKLIN